MCIRDSGNRSGEREQRRVEPARRFLERDLKPDLSGYDVYPVSYTHLRAHETVLDLVCRLLLEKKKI